jgi:orotate phosphoribosyltransferase
MERMAARAQFIGRVVPGAEYVLVDDVTNLGGTLAELSNYIQAFGGVVKDVVVLVNAGRNSALTPSPKFVRLIKERFDDEFTDVFGIAPDALTANEAQYLVGFKSVDAIRNRLAAAEQEIDRRLRSKGIARAPEATALGTRLEQRLSAVGRVPKDSVL